MKRKKQKEAAMKRYSVLFMFVSGLILASSVNAANFTVNVVDPDGNPVTGFRWLLEEDNTHPVEPGQRPAAGAEATPTNSTAANTIQALDFAASHAPLAVKAFGPNAGGGQSGSTGLNASSATIFNVKGGASNPRRYFVSVLPYSGYTMGGAPVVIDQGDANDPVTVVVNPNPVQTAQISVLVFEDNALINNAFDTGEAGLGGPDWNIIVEEPAGRYGIPGGPVLQDAFGNPLGTDYLTDANGNPILDIDGNPQVTVLGDGTIHPDPVTGRVDIKYLPPAKYGIKVSPPAGQNWMQTTTIEGTPVIDAWVKANEPPFFVEFGNPGVHVFVGFVQPFDSLATQGAGAANLSGQVTNLRALRPPEIGFFSGHELECNIGVNSTVLGEGVGLYAAPCDAGGGFTIPNVPAGDYQMVVWDQFLDIVIAFFNVTVNADGTCATPDGSCDLGDVSAFRWFGALDGQAYVDQNENGMRDAGEPPMPADSTAINIRFRDGTVYQSFPVDTEGFAPFDEVFPFFSWMVAEVDFATLKATGLTYTVDAGGPVAPGETLNPQAGSPVTQTGPVLTMGVQTFLGTTNRFEFGKAAYGTNENGGISGIVFNTITRAEDDPRYAAAEEWEPGIPRAQVALYQDNKDNTTGGFVFGGDGIPDLQGTNTVPDVDNAPTGNFPGLEDVDANGNGILDLYNQSDVDNYPLGWADGGTQGPEDIDVNGNGTFDLGDAVEVTWSDSWDDSKPTGCVPEAGGGFTAFPTSANPITPDCYDGLRNYNQVRDAVFDGGYAFGPEVDCAGPGNCGAHINEVGTTGVGYLKAGYYVVEGFAPPGYRHIAEEDKNVDFGNAFVPSPLLLPAVCVGDDHTVPDYLSFQTRTQGNGTIQPVVAMNELIAAPYAGIDRPLCDRKSLKLGQGQNAAADFFLMTEVPKAARVVGGVLDDLSNEFDPNSPNFGEKFSPPWLPIAFYDFNGNLVNRIHADEYGRFNALLPSTYTVNVPSPSGVAPNMLTACMNDATPIPNPEFGTNPNAPEFIPDPFHNPQYSQFCYTFQYMPGVTTYLDTPVLPLAAFAGPSQFPLDCEFDHQVPKIASVNRQGNGGGGPFVLAGQNIRIKSARKQDVPNPEYDGTNAKTISRQYGFGNLGVASTAELIDANGVATALQINSWNNGRILATVPGTVAPGHYQVSVTHTNGKTSPVGVTLTVGNMGGLAANGRPPLTVPNQYPTIQDAIDNAFPGDLILVAPGVYDEMVIMYKPVQLQGWGAQSTIINGSHFPTDKLALWKAKIATLLGNTTGSVANGLNGVSFDLVEGQPALNPLGIHEGAAITVLAHKGANKPHSFTAADTPRIDGFTITGGVNGGGIFVNGHANDLTISNNRIISNHGNDGGGIRVGHANLIRTPVGQDQTHSDAHNERIAIRYNHITQNGGQGGVGGGVALYTGADGYQVTDNMVCGNFSTGNGGGVGHFGQVTNSGGKVSTIARNRIVFNESFNQGLPKSGGGIFIGGKAALPVQVPAPGDNLSTGTGSVKILDNLIQGNYAGAGDGGGIRLSLVNGQDVLANPDTFNQWHRIDLFNNMIVNNVTGLAGAVSIEDALRVRIVNNTIANNDSTATAGQAFAPGSPNQSTEQPAGLVVRPNSAALNGVIGAGAPAYAQLGFSNPRPLRNNILWHNRMFQFVVNTATNPTTYGLSPNIGNGEDPRYLDIQVIGGGNMAVRDSILSNTFSENVGNGINHATNLQVDDAGLLHDYANGDRGALISLNEVNSNISVQPAFDEGGNFIDVAFGPLSLNVDVKKGAGNGGVQKSDYHLGTTGPAIDSAATLTIPEVQQDFDGDARPQGAGFDVGADERL